MTRIATLPVGSQKALQGEIQQRRTLFFLSKTCFDKKRTGSEQHGRYSKLERKKEREREREREDCGLEVIRPTLHNQIGEHNYKKTTTLSFVEHEKENKKQLKLKQLQLRSPA